MKSPVVIGATGGSGTRALRAILQASGAHMGSKVLPTGDAAAFVPFYDAFINPTMSAVKSLNYEIADVPIQIREPALAALRKCLAEYCHGIDFNAGPWGMKGPRSMYMLPYLHHVMPDMTFLHLVRDGRDMAISRNLGQVERHYNAVFNEAAGRDLALAAARLWAKANLEANYWCRVHLPDRHMVVRYEELRSAPIPTIAAILDFLGWNYSQEKCEQLAAIINPVENIGRWRFLPTDRQAAIIGVAQGTLAHFGYLDDTPGSTIH